MDGYANLIATRLRRLAETGSTGMLPVSGRGDGAVYFLGGRVVYAESSRTPAATPRGAVRAALASSAGPAPVPPGGDHPAGELVPARPGGGLAGMLASAEPTVDALTDLLACDSRYGKFRQAVGAPVRQVRATPLAVLLAEVQRRSEVLRQFSVVLTPDTVIAREPAPGWPSAQVSPAQWALLVRSCDGTTPRALALQLGRSVFGTTIEVYRLVTLGLLAVPGLPPAPGGNAPVLSFIRAAYGERSSDAR